MIHPGDKIYIPVATPATATDTGSTISAGSSAGGGAVSGTAQIAGIKCNGIEITKDVALESNLTQGQMESIINGQKTACANLGKIIDRLKRDDNGGLAEIAKKYLNLDLDNDKTILLKALGQIQTGLSSKYPGQFQAGMGGESSNYDAYVRENGQDVRWLDGVSAMTYENVIKFNIQAFGKSNCPMDEILVHEEAHISLYASRNEYYESDGYDLSKIPNNIKLINADSWRKFYSEALK